jgi:hypothetical protein
MANQAQSNLKSDILPIPSADRSIVSNNPEMPRELARFLLTSTATAIVGLTKPQHETMQKLESNLIFGRESGKYSSYSDFLEKAVDISFFAASFFLNTTVAGLIKDQARETIFKQNQNQN